MGRRWRWDCEDEDEALGLSTLCLRAGINVSAIEHRGLFVLQAEDEDAAAAAALESKIAGRYANRERKAADERLDRRDTYAHTVLIGGTLGLVIALLLSLAML